VLDGFQILAIGLPSFFLILRECFYVQVGLIQKIKGGMAQMIGFAEQLFVTFKRQV
jgi:hypothetical protein